MVDQRPFSMSTPLQRSATLVNRSTSVVDSKNQEIPINSNDNLGFLIYDRVNHGEIQDLASGNAIVGRLKERQAESMEPFSPKDQFLRARVGQSMSSPSARCIFNRLRDDLLAPVVVMVKLLGLRVICASWVEVKAWLWIRGWRKAKHRLSM